jgi:hypothetical protein
MDRPVLLDVNFLISLFDPDTVWLTPSVSSVRSEWTTY